MSISVALIGVCVAFIVGLTGFLVNRERDVGRPQRLRLVALALFGASALVVAWVAYATIFPPDPIAAGDVEPQKNGTGGTALDVTLPEASLQILVHGHLKEVQSRSGGEGRYTVELREPGGGKMLAAFDGKLDEHDETRRVMKRGVSVVRVEHLEGRHDVPRDVLGKPVSLVVTRQEGNLSGAMEIVVIHAPPPELALLIAGALLSLVGGGIDRRVKAGSNSYVGIGVAFYFAFALLILESTHPIEFKHLLLCIPMALLLGAGGGGLARVVVKPFIKPLPGSVPSSTSGAGGRASSAATPAKK